MTTGQPTEKPSGQLIEEPSGEQTEESSEEQKRKKTNARNDEVELREKMAKELGKMPPPTLGSITKPVI